jgi:hypothetical protein
LEAIILRFTSTIARKLLFSSVCCVPITKYTHTKLVTGYCYFSEIRPKQKIKNG